MAKGFFITFEGGEGVGKTTQIKRLEAYLKYIGKDVITTREPGGAPAAEEIRNLLSHDILGGHWTAEAEALLLFAARAMHIKDTIKPALDAEKIILCDRYIDSTRVYQGVVHKLDKEFIEDLERRVVGSFMPDLTIVLDLEATTAMGRVQSRGAVDHYDRGDLEFYQTLRDGFLEIATQNSGRCVVVDADKDEAVIAQDIQTIVSDKINV